MLLGLTLLVDAVYACPDRTPLLDTLERKAAEGRWEEADLASRAALEAFGCGPLADKAQLARVWLAEAVILRGAHEDVASDSALASAARLSPVTWHDAYPESLHERWLAVVQRGDGLAGRFSVEPAIPWYLIAIDGDVVDSLPIDLAPGLHLLQLGTDVSSMRTATRFSQPAGVDLVLDVIVPPSPPPVTVYMERSLVEPLPEPKPPTLRIPRRNKRELVGALGLAGGSAVLYGATWATNAAYYRDPANREALRAINDTLIVASGMGAVTATLMFVHGMTTDGR